MEKHVVSDCATTGQALFIAHSRNYKPIIYINMRKLLLLLTLLLSISTYVAAQNYTEVVYLKNGSIIKGVIIEQVPNVSLKIKTSDGSLIICQMSDVEKITKEERYTRDYRKEANNRKAARNTLKGYKGFVDFVNPEKPDVPLNKNDAFQKVQKRRVQEKR